MGICSIVAGITNSNLGTNPAWTDPAQCPECLNTLTAPVTCTGANSVAPTTAAPSAVPSSAPTQVPTHAPTHAPTAAAPQTAVSQTAASPAVTIATACLGALAFLIVDRVGLWFVGIVIAVLVLIILHKKKKPAAQAESKDAPVVVELVARIN